MNLLKETHITGFAIGSANVSVQATAAFTFDAHLPDADLAARRRRRTPAGSAVAAEALGHPGFSTPTPAISRAGPGRRGAATVPASAAGIAGAVGVGCAGRPRAAHRAAVGDRARAGSPTTSSGTPARPAPTGSTVPSTPGGPDVTRRHDSTPDGPTEDPAHHDAVLAAEAEAEIALDASSPEVPAPLDPDADARRVRTPRATACGRSASAAARRHERADPASSSAASSPRSASSSCSSGLDGAAHTPEPVRADPVPDLRRSVRARRWCSSVRSSTSPTG